MRFPLYQLLAKCSLSWSVFDALVLLSLCTTNCCSAGDPVNSSLRAEKKAALSLQGGGAPWCHRGESLPAVLWGPGKLLLPQRNLGLPGAEST